MKKDKVFTLSFLAVMTALVFISNYISVPFFSSRLHVANAVCILSALLFGGWKGALVAGLGSALFDLSFPQFVMEAPITFINKGAMALVAGLVMNKKGENKMRLYIAAALGALTYIFLYIFKSYIQLNFITKVPSDTIGPVLVQKLSASSINALFASIAAPILYITLSKGLKKAGLMDKISK